jgi:hypothetical protein
MQTHNNLPGDYSSLLFIGVILVAISQGIEGMTSPFAQFSRGFLIGLSIVCSLVGLYLYEKAKKPSNNSSG